MVLWSYGAVGIDRGGGGGGTEDDKEGPQWWQDMSGPVIY